MTSKAPPTEPSERVRDHRHAGMSIATAWVLAMLSLSQLLVQILDYGPAIAAGRASFIVLCCLLALRFGVREWVLLALALALALGLTTKRSGIGDILFALDRAAFFAAFIYLVTLLKEAAQRSDSVLQLGRYMTQQPSGRRYYALASGGHVMGVLLNFGAISLLTPLIQRGARASTNDLAEIALLERQQISALLRGFAWMIMWSPTALTQAVLFAAFPMINLGIVIPLGIAASIVMMFLGRLEGRRNAQSVIQFKTQQTPTFPTRSALRFMIICTAIILATFCVAYSFDVSAAVGLMLVAPIFLVVWIYEQTFQGEPFVALKETARTIFDILSGSSINLGLSAFILGAAGFIGEAAARLLPVAEFAQTLGLSAMPQWLFLMMLPVIITIGGQIALSPILVVVFLSAIINQLPTLPADPNLIVFALGAGWAMSMTASPNASATLLISGITKIAPTTLTWRWNGIYSVMCYAVFSLSFMLLTQIMPI